MSEKFGLDWAKEDWGRVRMLRICMNELSEEQERLRRENELKNKSKNGRH